MKQIALDGPAGAGKSTIAKRIAEKLQFVYIDTGAMYRTLALACLKQGVDTADEERVSMAAEAADLDIRYIDGSQHMFLEGEDVSGQIRTEEVSKAASDTSKFQRVRDRLVYLQQQLAEKYNVVMDGRDIGTVVLPHADLKIFMTASVEVRAMRRYKEYLEKGQACDLEAIKEDIMQRDYNDTHRANSPLRQAQDAVLLDTSDMSIDEVADEQVAKNPSGRRIYTYGPIIHNMEVVNDLKKKGVRVIESEEELPLAAGQILIIRSHGVKKRIYETAKDLGIEIVDATCPFVKKIHGIAEQESARGRQIIIVGNKEHPEVQGITGWVNGSALVVLNEEEAQELISENDSPATVVAQTTFNSNKFNNIVEIIKKKRYDVRVINTICNATRLRQKEAESVSRQVDIMLVVGDRHSSNTQKLFDICRTYCKDTYYIQTIQDLDEQILQSGIRVGITAGASTPNNIIQEVFLTCQKKKISTR